MAESWQRGLVDTSDFFRYDSKSGRIFPPKTYLGVLDEKTKFQRFSPSWKNLFFTSKRCRNFFRFFPHLPRHHYEVRVWLYLKAETSKTIRFIKTYVFLL